MNAASSKSLGVLSQTEGAPETI